MPLVWLDLPNWLPDDPKFQSGEYKADVRSGKRAETWSGGCERGPGPTTYAKSEIKRMSGPVSERRPGPVDASGVLVRQSYAKSEIRQM